MDEKERTFWHHILQGILDDYMTLLSGKRIKEGQRESSRYIRIDYYVETEGDLPAEELGKNIVRPLDHLKDRNVIEYKSWHESLNEDIFRHYIMRAMAVETPQKGISYRGDVTLTILTTHKPDLLTDAYYAFEPVNKWKYRSHLIRDIDIYVLVQREMRDVHAGEALALFQVLEGDLEKQQTVWFDLFGQDLDNTNVLKKIAEQISKEKVMSLVEELRKEGEIKGKTERSREIATEMLKDSMEISQIVKFTKLTEEEILALKAELDSKKE